MGVCILRNCSNQSSHSFWHDSFTWILISMVEFSPPLPPPHPILLPNLRLWVYQYFFFFFVGGSPTQMLITLHIAFSVAALSTSVYKNLIHLFCRQIKVLLSNHHPSRFLGYYSPWHFFRKKVISAGCITYTLWFSQRICSRSKPCGLRRINLHIVSDASKAREALRAFEASPVDQPRRLQSSVWILIFTSFLTECGNYNS
jgi:hypothetical protein